MIFFGVPSVVQLKPSSLFAGNDHYGFIQSVIGEKYDRIMTKKSCLDYYNKKQNSKYWDQIITYMNFMAFKKLDEKNQFQPNSILSYVADEYDKGNQLPSKILFDYFLSQWQFPHPINTSQKYKSGGITIEIDKLRNFNVTKPYGAILKILLYLNTKNKKESYISNGEFYWINQEFYKSDGAIFQPNAVDQFAEELYQKRQNSSKDFNILVKENSGKPYLSYPKGFLRNSKLLTVENIYEDTESLFVGLNLFALSDTQIVESVIKETYRTQFSFDGNTKPTDNELMFDYSNYIYSVKSINTWLKNIDIYQNLKIIFDKVKDLEREYNTNEYLKIKTNIQLNRLSVLDKTTISRTRTEQNILRNYLFKNKKEGKCALCQKNYPIKFLTTAHIKKRTYCSKSEKKNLNIVMPACKFGCDTLYEEGYILVQEGTIKSNFKKRHSTSEMIDYIKKNLENKNCLAWKEDTKDFFKHHAKKNA